MELKKSLIKTIMTAVSQPLRTLTRFKAKRELDQVDRFMKQHGWIQTSDLARYNASDKKYERWINIYEKDSQEIHVTRYNEIVEDADPRFPPYRWKVEYHPKVGNRVKDFYGSLSGLIETIHVT